MEGFATESTNGPAEGSVNSNKTINEKLGEIVHHAEMMTGASGAAIALREGDWLETRASTGTTAPDVGARSRIRGSFTGLVIETGKAVRCDDSDNDHRVDPAVCRSLQTRSIVVVPVRVDNIVTGVLAVFASSPHSFSNVHVSAIKTLAEIAGEIIAKFRPAEAGKRTTAKAEPHLEINRVSLEEPPVAASVEEIPLEEIAEEVQAILTESQMPVSAALVEREIPVMTEPVIGPGSFSQSPAILMKAAETSRTAEVIELRARKTEPEERKPEPSLKITEVAKPSPAKVAEPVKPEAALVLAMAAAPAPVKAETPAAKISVPKVAKDSKEIAVKRDASLAEASARAKAGKDDLITLAGEFLEEPRKTSLKPAATSELASWDLKPRRNFNFMKFAVPVGLAAALVLSAWLYVTKWRHGAVSENSNVTPTTEVQPPVVDPITAAAQAATSPSPAVGNSLSTATPTASSPPATTPAGLKQASIASTPTAQKPPEIAKTEDLEPEVVTSGPKPLVVQNAGAKTPIKRESMARAEAPQVIASAGALPLPSLTANGNLPKLSAKQSSLVPNQLMKSVPPVYPEAARRLSLAGAVTVEAEIAADGTVKAVHVLDGEPLLARAAVTAVRQWKYRPSYLNGEPVASTARVTLNFKALKE